MVFFMRQQIEINFLKEQSLMKGLTDEQLRYVKNHAVLEEYLPNDIIIEEGDFSDDVYLIVIGEVSVLKWDEEHRSQLPIGKLSKGEMFGEMSFMDGSPRSSTIKATKQTSILKFAKEKLIGTVEVRDIEAKMFANIAVVNINRLRESNKLFVKNLRSQLRAFQRRQDVGKLLIFQLLTVSFCLFLGIFFTGQMRSYLPWLFAIIPTCLMLQWNECEWTHFGWNIQKWRKVLLESFIVTVLLVLFLYFLRLVFQMNYDVNQFFRVEWNLVSINLVSDLLLSSVFYFLYCVSQEMIARGVIQTSLQEFLGDENGTQAIWMTSSFMLLFQLPMGALTALISFFSSLVLGFIFFKQKTLLGVVFIHFFVGLLVTQIPFLI